LFFTYDSLSQEILVGVSENTTLKSAETGPNYAHKSNKLTDTLSLPFSDDFSDGRSYPNPLLWSDNEAFINQDYGKYPITVGVATLDAIDANGNIYDNANAFPFEADHLTSNPIRLDSVFSPTPKALTPADSIYLSFYYQPQGWANDPQPEDSLLLEFLAIGENDTVYIEADSTAIPPQEADTIIRKGWNRVWAAGGQELEQFVQMNGRYFKRVMIPITDSAKYFNKNFRFRFRNFASLADNSLLSWQSNVDQWNIDYIELDWDRTAADTNHRDIAFVSAAPGFLKNYQSMPYWQYRANFIDEMDDSFEMLISNLDDAPHNASYKYNVYNPAGDNIKTYDAGSYTLTPFSSDGYVDYQPFTNPDITLPYPFSTDSIEFEVEHVLSTDVSLENRMNDTVRYTQKFYDYYAYDDGTAEAGYGLTPSGAMLAYKFQLNDPDTLSAVKFFFNKTWHNSNEQYFYLTVWNDNNGVPGQIIYQSESGILPDFSENINEFVSYDLAQPLAFNSQNETFYVGWVQTSDEILNVGFDYSRDNSDKIFYNTSGEWASSRYQGSLMIRPVFGITGSKNESTSSKQKEIKVYPNPVRNNEHLTLKLPANANQTPSDYRVVIYNLSGQVVHESEFRNNINIGHLVKGAYFIDVSNHKNGNRYTKKILITQ